jgi:LysR family glycine cleavage system transcriptional activator
LTAIEAFVHVARLGSVKAAADELALSSPALSRRLQTLERFGGRPLFERRLQALLLNGAGEAMLQRVGPALDALTDAIDAVTGEGELLRLRLAVPPLFASQRLMTRLPELRLAHPELHIDLDTAAYGLARLGEGIDAAIVLAPSIEPSLYARRIDRNKIYAIGARRLVDGPNALKGPADLHRMTIFLHRDMPEAFDVWREAAGVPDLEPAAVDHFDSGQLILDAAAQGLGVAYMLDSHLHHAHDSRLVRLFDVDADSQYSYWFVCRPVDLENRPVRMFYDWLIEAGL